MHLYRNRFNLVLIFDISLLSYRYMSELYASHFSQYSSQAIGKGEMFISDSGAEVPSMYADWAATALAAQSVEDQMAPHLRHIANTHTEATYTGRKMTEAYHQARETIKTHVGANEDDVLVLAGSGMTGALAHLHGILGWNTPAAQPAARKRWGRQPARPRSEDKPLVIVSAAEHHSNEISWRELPVVETLTAAYNTKNIVNLVSLRGLLQAYGNYATKVVTVTAASNVTGIRPPLGDIAEIAHAAGARLFVDGTCAMPYDDIQMHQSDESAIDALYFSPHKFFGGHSTPGVVVFNKELYGNRPVPVRPGGGTVQWVNPYGKQRYYDNETVAGIEAREDGGTPPFLGAIRAALAIRLKEEMGIQNIARREAEITEQVFAELEDVPGIQILADQQRDRLPIFPLASDIHYNAFATLMNDYFGVQGRPGCFCAGPYGHKLFNIGPQRSQLITEQIDAGNLAAKPGAYRLSFHPTHSPEEISYITDAVKQVAKNGERWLAQNYECDTSTMQFVHKRAAAKA